MDNGYLLIKDKDGKLKYFKDGKFFDLAEVERAEKQAGTDFGGARKKELKPILTFEQKKQPVKEAEKASEMVKPKLAPSVSRVKEIKLKAVEVERTEKQKTAMPIKSAPVREEIFEIEHLPMDEHLTRRRGDDQKLVDQHVNNVVARLKIQFHDEKIRARFMNLLTTFFRGLRTEKEVEYVLGTPKASGGLEISKEKISLVLIILRQELEAIAKERRDIVVEKKAEGQAASAVPQLMPPPPVVSKQPAVVRRQSALKTEATEETVIPFKPVTPKPIIQKPTSQPSQPAKPRLESFDASRRLIGPVEELAAMNLENFRRLGRGEEEKMEALLEKFQVLKEQSLVKKMEGIKAWKASPLFRLYLVMTLKGIQEKKSVSAVIEEKQIKNEECLTLSEYEMLAKLNRRLGE